MCVCVCALFSFSSCVNYFNVHVLYGTVCWNMTDTGIISTITANSSTTTTQPAMLPTTCITRRHARTTTTTTALFRRRRRQQQQQETQYPANAFSVRLPLMVAALVLLVLLLGVVEPCACSNGTSSITTTTTTVTDDDGNGGQTTVGGRSAGVHGMQNVTHGDGGLINCAVRNAVGACQPNDAGATADADGAGGGNGHRSSGRRAKVLSRNKRYVAFPEGSSFSVSVCLSVRRRRFFGCRPPAQKFHSN